MVARKPRLLQNLQQLLELILVDSQRNVYRGELDVRPRGAPPNERTDGPPRISDVLVNPHC